MAQHTNTAHFAAGRLDDLHLKHFLCVEYPGFVKNRDNALETLGGEKAVSQVASQSSKLMELRFRPKDVFCHPIYGDQVTTSNLLIRLHKKKKKDDKQIEHQHEKKEGNEWKLDVLGVVDNTYRFQGMADFQYLAPPPSKKKQKTVNNSTNTTTTKPNTPSMMIDSSMTSTTTVTDNLTLDFDFIEDIMQDLQEFRTNAVAETPKKPSQCNFSKAAMLLPPPIFSKIDVPQDYNFQSNPLFKMQEQAAQGNNTKPTSRVPKKQVIAPIIYATHKDPTPTTPLTEAVNRLNQKRLADSPSHTFVKKLFEDRPVWTVLALQNMVDHQDISKLRYLLPTVAYYMTSGPWRRTWIRFGYDPKTEPDSKKYQVIDLRVGSDQVRGTYVRVGEVVIKPRRMKKVTNVNADDLKVNDNALLDQLPSDKTDRNEREHTFTTPPSRQQTLYQLCDLSHPRMQNIVKNAIKHKYDSRSGWMPKAGIEKIRTLMKQRLPALLNPSLQDTSLAEPENPMEDIFEETEDKPKKKSPKPKSDKPKKRKKKDAEEEQEKEKEPQVVSEQPVQNAPVPSTAEQEGEMEQEAEDNDFDDIEPFPIWDESSDSDA